MGPFALSDLVGADIGLHVGSNFIESFPERVYKSPLFPLMNQKKRLGQKTGAGFYKYDEKRKATPDPEGQMPLIDEAPQGRGAPEAGLQPPEHVLAGHRRVHPVPGRQ